MGKKKPVKKSMPATMSQSTSVGKRRGRKPQGIPLYGLLAMAGLYDDIYDDLKTANLSSADDLDRFHYAFTVAASLDVLNLFLAYRHTYPELLDRQDYLVGNTALIASIKKEQYAHVEALLQAGASIHACDNKGATPLFHALKKGNVPIIRLLLRAGAHINKPDHYGMLPIMTALKKNRVDILCELIDHGVDVNAVDQTGDSALSYTLKKGNVRMVSILLRHGARYKPKEHEACIQAWIAQKQATLYRVKQVSRMREIIARYAHKK